MKRHVYKKGATDILIIANSQLHIKHFFLNSGILNSLSIPGGRIRNVYDFIPAEGRYETIILFIGGNDCFQKSASPSSREPRDIAGDLNDLANILTTRSNEVYNLGIPERHQQPERTKKVNDALLRLSVGANWKYRSLSKYIQTRHISGDDVHIDEEGLKNIKKLVKEKILRQKYDINLDNKGTSIVYKCGFENQRFCICGHYRPPN